jgi:hypothetical protein
MNNLDAHEEGSKCLHFKSNHAFVMSIETVVKFSDDRPHRCDTQRFRCACLDFHEPSSHCQSHVLRGSEHALLNPQEKLLLV